MSIEERMRAGLAANAAQLDPDLEVGLARVVHKAHRRRQARVLEVALAAAAAAAVAIAVAFGGVPGMTRSDPVHDPANDPSVELPSPRSMEGINGALAPGAWIMPMVGGDPASLPRAVVQVPEGYGSPGGFILDRGADGDAEHGDLGFWTADLVLDDPCHLARPVHPGPTVRDLATALQRQRGTEVSRPEPVTLDGHHGLYLEVALRDASRLRRCEDVGYRLWVTEDGSYYENRILGTTNYLWIIDVDGTRVVVAADTTSAESPTDTAELLAIARSARFIDPLTASP